MENSTQFSSHIRELILASLWSNIDILQAGLFSAILVAFLVDNRKGSQGDLLEEINNNLLRGLIQEFNNSSNPTGSSIPSPFQPPTLSEVVNVCWFTGLIISLASAFGIIIVMGWVTGYPPESSVGDVTMACDHLSRKYKAQKYRLKRIIETLPQLLLISFFLFLLGVIFLLAENDHVNVIVVSMLTLGIISGYLYAVHMSRDYSRPSHGRLKARVRLLLHVAFILLIRLHCEMAISPLNQRMYYAGSSQKLRMKNRSSRLSKPWLVSNAVLRCGQPLLTVPKPYAAGLRIASKIDLAWQSRLLTSTGLKYTFMLFCDWCPAIPPTLTCTL